MIDHRSYIVVEIPEPVRSQIQALRDSYNAVTATLPVEITLAGSSGVGPIPAGSELPQIECYLDRVLANWSPFSTKFSAIRNFPNSSVFYLEPHDRTPFERLHQELRISGIPFSESVWPYNPHCTLSAGKSFLPETASELLSQAFPKEEFLIDTVSVYYLDDRTLNCKLLYERKLNALPDRCSCPPCSRNENY